ncbi:AMP-binding protein [Sphingobium sp. V4]|uniref:AMP-binding protein n=1 Tax=Sphingobium sp. V4 TaxID=3038927 RepID=UPI002557E9B1|nr:AMP-binding protein [Sphingobium sp. V4]WIW89491.1 AMP-binding protein [Sphingobium sp. V4]
MKDLIDTMDANPETVRGLLVSGARDWPDRPFVLFEDWGVWSRRDALEVALSAAAAMQREGVRAGDRVCVILPNGPDWLRAWWGAALLGAIVVPFNPSFVGRILEELLETTDPSFVIASSPVSEAPAKSRYISPASLAVPSDTPPILSEINGDSPHVIIFTSGTTGRSKGSLTSNFHVINQSFWMAESGDVGESDRFMGDLPLFHMAALGNFTLMMRVGGSIALRTRPSLSRYWEIARDCETTFGVLVSSMAAKLMQDPPSPADRDHKMRFFLSSPLPPDPAKFVERFGLEGLCTGFGSTETSTALCKPLGQPVVTGSCGQQRKGYELRIVDEDFNDVADGERGELLIRTTRRTQMSLGYFNNPEATAEAWHDGWYRTGDLFERDAEGNFFWRDRLKDSIRRRGENVSSQEVEREINLYPGVLESACVAVQGAFQGDEEIKAFLVIAGEIDFGDLVRHLDGRLPYFMIPRFFERIDELPRTPTMKVQKFLLKERPAGPAHWDREAVGITLNRSSAVANSG